MARIKATDQKGTVTIYVAGMMTVLILILNVVVVDVGRVFLNQEKATVAADAAAGAALGVAYDTVGAEVFARISKAKGEIESEFAKQALSESNKRDEASSALRTWVDQLMLSPEDKTEVLKRLKDLVGKRVSEAYFIGFLEGKVAPAQIDEALKRLLALKQAEQQIRDLGKNRKAALAGLEGIKSVRDLDREKLLSTIRNVWLGQVNPQSNFGYDRFVGNPQSIRDKAQENAVEAARFYATQNEAPNVQAFVYVDSATLKFTAVVQTTKSSYSESLGKKATTSQTRVRSYQ